MATKLSITRCTISGGKVSATGDVFKATINPSEYKQNFGITYRDRGSGEATPIGKSAATPKFGSVNAETISFAFVIDGTGVVEAADGLTVKGQIEALRKIVYDFNGSTHETNVVRIAWGEGMDPFDGRLESMDFKYTLFRATGEPLRANVEMKYVSYVTPTEEALAANRTSPDLTHRVTVRAGDTLPLLCKRIYDDPTRYLFVAAANGLASFRRLDPGLVLSFPPLPKGETNARG